MKQVTFPLSVAFIAADGTIVNIEDLNPGDPREAAAIAPVPFVLEMERGWFAEHGIAPGDRVLLPGQPDPPGEEEAT